MSTTRPDRSTPSEDAARAADESRVGQTVGKYEITRVLGRGGMGTVYEALNTAIGKRVAMKFVDAEAARNKDSVARFQREAQAASAVESAHIVEIFDSGTSEDGMPFIVMELLRGEDLGHRIKRNGRLELHEALHIVAQILRGLHRAHEAGIVHRDLKPDNIFLVDRDDDANFAKILDFGISKVQRQGDVPVHTLTRQGTVLGTPFYMSPEQAQALADIDGRTDLWSVGAILYECLTGRPPYSGQTYEQVIINICMKDAEDVRVHNPAVPEGIALALKKALSREREGRFSNAREFLDGLISASGGLLSSRPALQRSSDDGASSPQSRTPSVPASTPNTGPQAGYEPTLEVQANIGNVSRVGWATNGSRALAARRDRKRFILVAGSALVLGAVAAFVFVQARRAHQSEAAAVAAAQEVEVHLKSNVPATFTFEGQPLEGGVVRGTKGHFKKVHVEADGFIARDVDVALDESRPEVSVTLKPLNAPVISPAETASASTSSAPTADAEAKKPPKGPKTSGGVKVAPPPPSKTGDAPKTTPPSGVAGELKLKTD